MMDNEYVKRTVKAVKDTFTNEDGGGVLIVFFIITLILILASG